MVSEVDDLKVLPGLDGLNRDYALEIYAEKIHNTESKFGEKTCQQLLRLIEVAPFDVGYDNIFRDEEDNAIII